MAAHVAGRITDRDGQHVLCGRELIPVAERCGQPASHTDLIRSISRGGVRGVVAVWCGGCGLWGIIIRA